jgi:hypothetical protein
MILKFTSISTMSMMKMNRILRMIVNFREEQQIRLLTRCELTGYLNRLKRKGLRLLLREVRGHRNRGQRYLQWRVGGYSVFRHDFKNSIRRSGDDPQLSRVD